MRFHPTPNPTDKPPPVGEEEIEGAQDTSYTPVITSGHPSDLPMLTPEGAPRHATDEAFASERHYGNLDNANDDVGNHDVIVKQTYNEGDKEELDYNDDPPNDGEDMVTKDADYEADNADEADTGLC